MHPFLKDTENNRAYAFLSANPIGSLRTWADSLSWSQGQLQRFLKAASEFGLAEVTTTPRSRKGSTFTPCLVGSIGTASAEPDAVTSADAVDAVPTASRPIRLARAASGLTTKPGLTAVSGHPRDLHRKPGFVVKPGSTGLRKKANDDEEQPGGRELIAVMNETLCPKWPLDFLPVQLDNHGSHRAARIWLVDNHIPLPDAIDMLRKKCHGFDPARMKCGDPPRSLGCFTRSIVAEWKRVLRDREQLKLFAKMDVHIEPRPPRVPHQHHEEPKRPTSAEAIAQARAEMERLRNDPKAKEQRL